MLEDRLNWNDLRYFLELARQGRLLGAARRLGVNHTTVARRLAALEEALETPLFEQDERGYHLTEAGEVLLPLAQQVEDVTGLARERAGQTAGQLSGRLRVGAPDGFGNAFLAPGLGPFLRQQAGLTLELVPVPRSHDLLKREVDLAVSLEPVDRPDIICRKITDYRLFLYTSDAYLAASGVDPEDMDQVLKAPFTGYIPDILYTEQLSFNPLIDPGLETVFQSATVLAQQNFVANGGGFGVLAAFMACNDPRLRPVQVERISFTRTYWLLIPTELRRRAAVRAVERAILAMAETERDRLLPETPIGHGSNFNGGIT